jgi:pimeloyl-ACP methyl ester carboxylesterase
MQAMAAKIRGCHFEVIEHAGHLSPLEQPAAFERVLVSFLAR